MDISRAAEQTQSAETITTEQIVEAVLKDSSIDECVVLLRETTTSERDLIAYVVSSRPFSLIRLQSHLQTLLPAAWVPSTYVPVSTLPLTPTGQVDKLALASLEVIDSDLVQRWSEQLQSLPEVEQVAVVVQECADVPPLHLSDLLPGRGEGESQRRAGVPEVGAAVGGETALQETGFPPQATANPKGFPDLRSHPRAGVPPVEGSGVQPTVPVEATGVGRCGDAEMGRWEDGEQSESGPKALAISYGGALQLEADAPTTLAKTLQRSAQNSLQQSITYIQSNGSKSVQSYAALLAEAERILAGLRQLGLKPQDQVILQLELTTDIIPAFWGCILGGFIPVIMAVPPTYQEANGALDKLCHIWQLLDKPLILTSEALTESVRSRSQWLPFEDSGVSMIENLRTNKPDTSHHQSLPDDVAFFTLTSGSTGVPKCIMLTHRNLLSRARGAIQLCQHKTEDIILNWLPFDHIGSISDWHLRCVYLGCQLVYAPKEYVLGRPLNWLNLIDQYRVTHNWAPNFAYSLINDALKLDKKSQWSLGCVKSLITAGESVSPKTVEEFVENLAPYGLKPTAIQPGFGMAESGSGINYFQYTEEKHPQFHTVERDSLDGAVINVSLEQSNSITFTSLGPVIPGVSMRIVDDKNRPLSENTVGLLQVKGDAVFPGYYKAPEVNKEVFLEDGWFNTGDLGFISQGCLVITGRAKETIIINGNNYYSSEIEAVVEEVEGVEVSYTAACSVRDFDSDTEKLAVFFNSLSDDERLIKLIKQIQEKVVTKVRVKPDYLIPVEKESIPKTAIGKIQRSQLSRRFEAGEFNAILKRLDILSNNANTLPDWFYRKIWRPMSAVSLTTQPTTGRTLVFLDSLGLGAFLCKELSNNQLCISVEAGSDFNQISDNRYRIVPQNPDHYRQLLESLLENNIPITEVLHLWTYDEYAGEISSPEALEQSQLGVYSLLFLIQALAPSQGSEQSVRLCVIASHTQPTSAVEKIAYEKAPVLGLVKTITQEMPWLDCHHVDLAPAEVEVNAAYILQELRTTRKDPEVAYRNGQRLVARLEKVNLSQEEKQEIPFKHGGMYLLSGGLGGIGVEIAKYLLKHYGVRLLLVGRTPLPDRSRWDADLQQVDAVAQRIKAYRSLEPLGGEIIYSTVDVCDQAQLQQVVDQAKQRWQCELDGVIHLAGISQENLLIESTRSSFAAVLRPKVLGTWVLAQLLKGHPNSIFISSSSVNSFFGGTTVGAYAAANSFLDCFSHYQRSQQLLQSYCFAWSMWDEVGMSRGYQMKELSRAQGYHAITPAQGLQSLLVGLHHAQAQLLVGLDGSNRQIQRYVETEPYCLETITAYFTANAQLPLTQLEALSVQDRFGTHSTCRFVQLPEMPLTKTGEINREQLANIVRQVSTEWVAPTTELELQLASIWQEVLGLARVGIHDNFFALGGNSLLTTQAISRVRNALNVDLTLHEIFKSPTLAGWVESIKLCTQSELEVPIIPVARTKHLPLSFAQQRFWFLNQLEPSNAAYNLTQTIRLAGPLNVITLEQSLNEILQRHEVLRTCFIIVDGKPAQVISPSLTLTLPVINLELLEEPEAEVLRLATEEAQRPFDLAQGPLIRVQLLRLAQQHVLVLSVHHIAFDGWSVDVFMQELTLLYEAFSTSQPSPLPNLPIQYADFANWQRQWQQGEVFETQLAYWKQVCQNLPVLQLPTDRTRPPIQTYRGARQSLLLSRSLTEAIKALGQHSGGTLFMTLLAAFKTLLYRYTGQEDILVGSPIAHRNRVETEELIGCLINTLALRTDLSGQPSFRELLSRVREVALGAYTHQGMPFEKLVEELQVERDLSRSPLFQVMFVLQKPSMPSQNFSGLSLNSLQVHNGTSIFDLTLELQETPEGLSGWFEYNTDLFDAGTISRIAEHFQTLLSGIVVNPNQPISTLPLLSAAEQLTLLVEWNDIQVDYPKVCIHQLFEAQVARTPDAVALVFEQEWLSYRELNNRANQLARYLQNLGVGPEVLVGICMERSLLMLVGILGILKAGGAYVPLDPAYPQERLAFMIADTQTKILVTQSRLIAALPEHQASVVCLDTDWKFIAQDQQPASGVTTDNLAYIIYTSGSTGRPKGVLVTHRGLYNLAKEQIRAFGLQPHNHVLEFSSFSFDGSVSEVFPALCAGATLYLGTQDSLMPGPALIQMLRDQSITNATLPPSALAVLPLTELPALQTIIVAGEACSADTIALWAAADRRFFNAYGPTEATVCTTIAECTNCNKKPPIGRPIANMQVYILDSHLQPVPVGVSGELYIGSDDSLARGYLNRPELTAEKFIPHLYSKQPGARLYKTGDLARYLSDGNIEFLGRIDHQVKLRGFRIELGEIEAALSQYPAVQHTVVLAREDIPGDKRLVAYVVSDQAGLTPGELRRCLQEQLPEYMIPTVVILKELPLTPNGKVDRQALPKPEVRGVSAAYVVPQTEVEQTIATVWQEVLDVKQVGLHDNFFELGGHSLLMAQLHNRLGNVLEQKISIIELFKHPTIGSLAKYLSPEANDKPDFQKIHDRVKKQKDAINRQKQLKRGK